MVFVRHIFSGEFSENMQNFFRQNMRKNVRNLAKYAAQWCTYAACVAYVRLFFCIFLAWSDRESLSWSLIGLFCLLLTFLT